VQVVCNLIEKEYVAPRGDTSKIPMPHPCPQMDPSKYMAHARMESTAILILNLCDNQVIRNIDFNVNSMCLPWYMCVVQRNRGIIVIL
jgi:hypothetical protein